MKNLLREYRMALDFLLIGSEWGILIVPLPKRIDIIFYLKYNMLNIYNESLLVLLYYNEKKSFSMIIMMSWLGS